MNFIFIVFIFILGTLIGSFINVVALRYNSGMSSLRGRSKCFNCATHLKWFELIPICSFLFLRGKCRTCKSYISPQYIVMELLLGLIFVGLLLRQYNLWNIFGTFPHGLLISTAFFLFYATVFSLLLIIMVYDVRHKIIPDVFVYSFIVLSVLKMVVFIYCRHYSLQTLDYLDVFSPFILFTPFALLWFVSGGRWIGFGDAKLAFGIGALLGFVSGVSAIVLAFWIGALWSIFILFREGYFSGKTKKIGMKTEVPFAPFMILATAIVFLTRIDVIGLQDFLSMFIQL